MQKIPTIFIRDPKPKCTPVTEETNPECQWVFDGEGIATRKLDGINIKVENGIVYERIKPETADYAEADYGAVTKKGIPEAAAIADGIYEAIGPTIRGNPERMDIHRLVSIYPRIDDFLVIHHEPKRTYRDIMGYLATNDIEGIVYHHRDGRMAKIKTRDFYHLKRPQ